MTNSKKLLLLIGVFIFSLFFYYKFKTYLSDGSGLKDFYFKIDSGLNENPDVYFYTPLNSTIPLKKDSLGVYSFDNNKTAVSTIKIKSYNDKTASFYFRYSQNDSWLKIDNSQISFGNEFTIINPPSSSKSFFPYFNNIFNWQGDFSVMAFLLIEQLFILWIVAMIYIYRAKIAYGLNSVKLDLFKTQRTAFVFFLFVIIIGLFLNIQNSSYLIMSFRHPDEVVIINPIFFNPLKFWNGVYDSQYNLLQLLFSLPGLVFNNYQVVGIGNRMLTSVFAGLSLVYIFKIIGLFTESKLQNILFIILLLTVPGFWINLNIARPDWVMTGALIISFYFLVKDNGSLKINFWISIVMFAYACAIKFHSIQYLPVFAVFWLSNFGKREKWKLLLNIILLFIVSYFVLNFERLSLNNLKTFASAMIWQLDGNTTGYGTSKFMEIPVSNKINTLKIIYTHVFLLAMITISHFYIIYLGVKNLRYKSIGALAIGNILVVVYNVFFVNKNWQNYYLTFMIIGFLIFFISVSFILKRHQKFVVTLSLVFISLQIYSYNATYIDIKNDYYITKQGENEYKLQIDTWSEIAEVLNDSSEREIKILKSMYIAFDYLELKKAKNIQTVDIGAGNLELIFNKDVNYLTSFDFIILRKYPPSHSNFILTKSIDEVLIQQQSEMLLENELTRVYRIKK